MQWWLDDYDWRAVEAEINALPNYRVEIDGQVVHYVHVPGKGPDPLPIVLTHGWPWSFWDYRKVIGPLSDPAAHGGDPADAFDVIVPSIPGYGFSTPMRAGQQRQGHRGPVGAAGSRRAGARPRSSPPAATGARSSRS